MSEHASDPGVYIRSMATRGHLGGLAWAAPQAIRVLDAAGCEVILVETVGVGQSEVEIASQADTSVVLLAPGMGDGIQAAKAGILEIGDVYVVNKADRDGADATARELNHMLGLGESRGPGDWRPPIVKTVAARGEGIDEVVEALEKHHAWMAEHGVLAERRRARAAREVETIAVTALRERIGSLHGDRRLDALADRIVDGDLDPYAAADELVAGLTDRPDPRPRAGRVRLRGRAWAGLGRALAARRAFGGQRGRRSRQRGGAPAPFGPCPARPVRGGARGCALALAGCAPGPLAMAAALGLAGLFVAPALTTA